jgi:hypothetical protein
MKFGVVLSKALEISQRVAYNGCLVSRATSKALTSTQLWLYQFHFASDIHAQKGVTESAYLIAPEYFE